MNLTLEIKKIISLFTLDIFKFEKRNINNDWVFLATGLTEGSYKLIFNQDLDIIWIDKDSGDDISRIAFLSKYNIENGKVNIDIQLYYQLYDCIKLKCHEVRLEELKEELRLAILEERYERCTILKNKINKLTRKL